MSGYEIDRLSQIWTKLNQESESNTAMKEHVLRRFLDS